MTETWDVLGMALLCVRAKFRFKQAMNSVWPPIRLKAILGLIH